MSKEIIKVRIADGYPFRGRECDVVKAVIPKGNGKHRTIYIPDVFLKQILARCVEQFTGMAANNDRHKVQHGFTPVRSPATNAASHVGWKYTMTMDLEDWFDTVRREDHLTGINEMFFIDGHLPQGYPTSPPLANLAAVPMDNAIMQLQNRGRFLNFVYTRYADDLTFSFNHFDTGQMLMSRVPAIIRLARFKVNEAKTKWQCALAGRRIITGVAVDDRGIHPTRDVRRRIRAIEHQLANGFRRRGLGRLSKRKRQLKGKIPIELLAKKQLAGLKEWSRLNHDKTKVTTGRDYRRRTNAVTVTQRTMQRQEIKPFTRKFA